MWRKGLNQKKSLKKTSLNIWEFKQLLTKNAAGKKAQLYFKI